MSRSLIALAIALIFSSTIHSQQKSDLQNEALQGSVHTVESESYSSMIGDGTEGRGRTKQLDTLTFNRDGKLVQRLIYDDYGFLVGTEKYSHNAAGERIAAVLIDP